MNNEEIKALLRDLSEKADSEGKSTTVRIELDQGEGGSSRPGKPRKEEKAKKSSTLFSAPHKSDRPVKPEKEERPEARRERPVRHGNVLVEPAHFESDADDFRDDTETERPGSGAEKAAAIFAGVKGLLARRPKAESEPEPETASELEETEKAETEAETSAVEIAETEQETEAEEKGTLKDRILHGDGSKHARNLRIGILAVAAVALLLILVTAHYMKVRQKSRNVTADNGLTVTVESEPETWTDHALVTLGIRTPSAIQEISVNGKSYEFEGKKKTQIQVDAKSPKLKVHVVTENGEMNATAGIPMIDGEPPVVTLKASGAQATIEAVDKDSGLEGIWYGEVVGLSDVAVYQRYAGTFHFDPSKKYRFYAQDKAGNIASFGPCSLQTADSVALADSTITLFPEQTYQLKLVTDPLNAFVNGVSYSTDDDSVATVSDKGLVTAVSEGTANVTVNANGFSPLVLHVSVQTEAQVKISCVGDLTLGDDITLDPTTAFSAVQLTNGNSWFFDNVRNIFRDDDITFGNFEGTLSSRGTRAEKTYAFRGDPSYTAILNDGSIDVVSLANNHSSDYGEESNVDTKSYLSQAGIDYCTGSEIAYRTVNGIKVAMIGIYELDQGDVVFTDTINTINMARSSGAQLVVVAFHWGTESMTTPEQTQIDLAHTAIDNGADLVVGHHPHVLQGIEQYNGKYIAYSLGNFCFGGNSYPSDMDTMIFGVTYTLGADGSVTDTKVNITPCTISSDTTINNYQPTPAQGEEAQRIIQKINDLSAQFGYTVQQ